MEWVKGRHMHKLCLRTPLVVELQSDLCVCSNTEVVVDHFERYIGYSFMFSF